MNTAETNSPVIYRCSGCGAIVHPPDPISSLVAWCGRCRRYVTADVDGGPAPRGDRAGRWAPA